MVQTTQWEFDTIKLAEVNAVGKTNLKGLVMMRLQRSTTDPDERNYLEVVRNWCDSVFLRRSDDTIVAWTDFSSGDYACRRYLSSMAAPKRRHQKRPYLKLLAKFIRSLL